MAIVQTRKPPAAGIKAVGRALNDLVGAKATRGPLGGGAINLSQPLPVYRISLEDIAGPASLERARQVGWRYLVEGVDGGMAYADVRETGGDDVKFSSLSRNDNAGRLTDAARLAQNVASGMKADCEARILDVPALYISAVWLTGPKPVFIPYIDGERLLKPNAEIAVRDDFLNELTASAEATMNRSQPFSEKAG